MIESFFFLSLGVVFVLLLLLVYHFKQRIANIEQKSDTMFDIVQNLAKELTAIKGHLTKPSCVNAVMNDGGFVRLEEDEYEEEDEDEEEEDDEDEDEDDDDEDEEEDDDDESVKVIDISVLAPVDQINENDDSDSISDSEPEIVELKEDESNKIKVLKISESVSVPQYESVSVPQYESVPLADVGMSVYKKMTVGQLRTLVISKGLCSDASKFGKNELLKMLSVK